MKIIKISKLLKFLKSISMTKCFSKILFALSFLQQQNLFLNRNSKSNKNLLKIVVVLLQ